MGGRYDGAATNRSNVGGVLIVRNCLANDSPHHVAAHLP